MSIQEKLTNEFTIIKFEFEYEHEENPYFVFNANELSGADASRIFSEYKEKFISGEYTHRIYDYLDDLKVSFHVLE